MKKIILYSFLLSLTSLLSGCSRLFISQKKGIVYRPEQKLELNVFAPRKKTAELKKVMVFIHGGNWKTGNKSMYSFFGKRM
ncbi:MAG: carboxylesterase family protein, partial [Bacteroidetes bacterium]|nr:carboxylesterase family protein [Bacteroidota bacterium]